MATCHAVSNTTDKIVLTQEMQEADDIEDLFTVKDPVLEKDTDGMIKFGMVHKYVVTGVDDEGEFRVVRRYKEFAQLHESLIERWPGCFVPGVPPKDPINNKNADFVEKRRQLLERYMKELSRYRYLVNSFEFKIFTRNEDKEITDLLKKLPKQTPG